MQLQTGIDNFPLQVSVPQLCSSAFLGGQLFLVMAVQSPIEMRPANLQLRLDIGQYETGVLEIQQWLTEHNPFAAERDGFIKSLLRAGHRRYRNRQTLLRQFAHQIDEALAFFAQTVGHWHADIFEEQFRGISFIHTDFVEVTAALEAVTIRLNEDNRHALIRWLDFGVGFDADQDQVGVLAIGDIGFAAVDDIMVAVFTRGGLHALKIASGAGLRHGDGGDDLARDHLGQPMLFLLFAAVAGDIVYDDI